MKNIQFYLFCILIVLCFLLTTRFLGGIIYFFPLYQIERGIRSASGCFYTFIVMMRISSLLAVALASFCFGFITHFNCKLAGLSASLYLILDCLSLLHLLHLGLFEPIVVYIALTYIPPALAAYFVGSFFCSLSKKLKVKRIKSVSWSDINIEDAQRSWRNAPDEHLSQAVKNTEDYNPQVRAIIIEEAKNRFGKDFVTESTLDDKKKVL